MEVVVASVILTMIMTMMMMMMMMMVVVTVIMMTLFNAGVHTLKACHRWTPFCDFISGT